MDAAQHIRAAEDAIGDAMLALDRARAPVHAAYGAADEAYRAALDPEAPGIIDAEVARRYAAWAEAEQRATLAEECLDDLERMRDWLRSAPINLRALAASVAKLLPVKETA